MDRQPMVWWVRVLAGIVLAGLAAGAQAAGPSPEASGAELYKQHCARCHGAEGRGDGPAAPGLLYVPSDLTGLSRRAGGRFPSDLVARVIDGRASQRGHGGTEMPVWGDALKVPEQGYDEKKVRESIARLVRHLESIQEKARR
jgi:mono/diheme cytochrome c family protein